MFHYWIKNHRVFNCLMKTSIKELHPQMGPFLDKNMLCSMCIVLWNLFIRAFFCCPCLFRRTGEQRLYESLPKSGVLTSPNFPSNYPNNLHQGKTIEVAKGDVINNPLHRYCAEYQVDFDENYWWPQRIVWLFWRVWLLKVSRSTNLKSLNCIVATSMGLLWKFPKNRLPPAHA